MNRDILSDIFLKVKLDHPMIFYVKTLLYRTPQGGRNITVIPTYSFKKSQTEEMTKAVLAHVNKITAPAAEIDEIKKERYVHDYIIEHALYDKLKKHYSHEVTGLLFHGISVCEGIAKTAKLLFDALDMNSLVVIGDAGGTRHAWNIVYHSGIPYHLDITFDRSLKMRNEDPYRYFNRSDAEISATHQNITFPVPVCGQSMQ